MGERGGKEPVGAASPWAGGGVLGAPSPEVVGHEVGPSGGKDGGMGEHSDWQVDVGTRLPSQLPVAWLSAGAWGVERWMALPVFVSYTRGIKLGNGLGRRRGCSCEAALAFSAPLRSHGALSPSQAKTTRVQYEKRSTDRNVNVHLREITKRARPTNPPVHQPVVMLESVVARKGAPRRVVSQREGGTMAFQP